MKVFFCRVRRCPLHNQPRISDPRFARKHYRQKHSYTEVKQVASNLGIMERQPGHVLIELILQKSGEFVN